MKQWNLLKKMKKQLRPQPGKGEQYMATVTNWIDHLNKPAEEVAGAVYPGAGSSEGILVIIAIILWVGWHVLTAKSESEELDRLARKRHGANDHKSNITDW